MRFLVSSLICLPLSFSSTAFCKKPKPAPQCDPAACIQLVATPDSFSVPSGTATTVVTQVKATKPSANQKSTTLTISSDFGISATFDSSTIEATDAAGTRKLTITVDKDLLPGDYNAYVSANDGTESSLPERITIHVGEDGRFSAVFGLGSLISGRPVTNYKVQNDTLVATNLGRAQPELNLGGAFRVNLPMRNLAQIRYPWSAFVSLRLAPGEDKTVSGYVFGASYRLARYLDVLVGYSLTRIDEPSVGFRNAAVQVVQNNPSITIYQRFNASDMLQNRVNAFDGFPLAIQDANGPTGQRVFATDPLVPHHRGGMFLGVAFPLAIKAKLQ